MQLDSDSPVNAFPVIKEVTDENNDSQTTEDKERDETQHTPEKNPHAVALGRLGGKKGGKARAEKLSAERRREIARQAARVRWERRRNG